MATVDNTAELMPLDRPLSKPNRQQQGSPVGTLTPLYAGELVLDTATAQVWCGGGNGVNTNWTPVFLSE